MVLKKLSPIKIKKDKEKKSVRNLYIFIGAVALVLFIAIINTYTDIGDVLKPTPQKKSSPQKAVKPEKSNTSQVSNKKSRSSKSTESQSGDEQSENALSSNKQPEKQSDATNEETTQQDMRSLAEQFTEEVLRMNSGILRVSAEFVHGVSCSVQIHINLKLFDTWKISEKEATSVLHTIREKAIKKTNTLGCLVHVYYDNKKFIKATRESLKSTDTKIEYLFED